MPTVYLIRHGMNDYAKKQRLAGRLPGVHLNEQGRAEVAALAEALKGIPLKAVYSSPLDRAVETAQSIASMHGLQVEKRPNLIETALGEWEGQSVKRLSRDKRWKQLQENPAQFRFPAGEWMVEQQARLVAEVETLCTRHKQKDYFAIVGHADPLKLVIAHFIGLPLDLFQRLVIDTASVSTLMIGRKEIKLVNLNLRAKEFGSKPV
ncbi:MAG: histidine phosphatase family protein [Chloroflexi bacterium]|nr:histidine phosphatase family protein [Chloroflexota bacterium]